MEAIKLHKWFYIGLINLAFVALYGVLMRYKIAFSFPFLEQKFLLHAHSHFAFSGWVSHFIYTGLAILIAPFLSVSKQKVYDKVILFNIICAYGMLFSFTIQGYKLFSIIFSTLTILISIFYAWIFIKDSAQMPTQHPAKRWAIGGLLLNIVSAAGPLYLAYMMMTKNIQSEWYLGSVYYFLHFQYSGWFFFGCMAMVIKTLPNDDPTVKKYFWILVITAVLTVFLSILWAKLPIWLYTITVVATMIQLIAWIALVKKFLPTIKKTISNTQPGWIQLFLYGAIFSMTIKFILQSVSVVPSLSELVFGIRPIVIAYLHLVLLGAFSLFIIGYSFSKKIFQPTIFAKVAAIGFFVGVVLNELFLGIQGMAAFTYTPVPYINQLLFIAALVLLGSAISLAISQRKNIGKNYQD